MHNRAKVQLGDVEIAYTDEGVGPPLLLLHGAPTTSYVYRHVITHLRGSFRCLAPDFPGWGDSSPMVQREPTLPALSDVVSEFVNALDLSGVTLAVMDTAGSSGVHAVQRDPSRYSAMVIADTFVFPTREYPAVHRMLKLVTSPPLMWLNRQLNLLPRLVSRFGGRGRRLTLEEEQRYDRAFATHERRDRVMVPLRDLTENAQFLKDVADGLPSLTIPTLLICGQFDPVLRVGVQRRLEEILPNPTAVVIPGEAHFPQEGDPETFAGAILGWATSKGIVAPDRRVA